jgi:tRNA-dihydrouridine synthase C
MEGVVDYEMRNLLTRLGGFDRCVTEFIRVNDQVLPERVFLRFSPELENGGVTTSGVPVYLQLLGGSAKFMALNAKQAQSLTPPGIDLNFGCPSNTVTRNNGGSGLLVNPQLIGDIVASVREAVDPGIPVTAKIRLGFSNSDHLENIVDKIVTAGANELCIHARTREDRYKAPAYWSSVKTITDKFTLPITINGEIWSVENAYNARRQSGCPDIMLGRGALTSPQLAARIKAHHLGSDHQEMNWPELLRVIVRYLRETENKHPHFVCNRSKQWLAFLLNAYPEALSLFHQVKRVKNAAEMLNTLRSYT